MNRIRFNLPATWVPGLLLPCVVIVISLLTIPGFTGDDSYIHFTYARNLIERGVIGYNTSVPSYGSTSILWVLLCAGLSLLTGNIPITGQVLSGLFFIASVFLFVRYLSKHLEMVPREIFFGSLLYCANAVLFRWILSGMETTMVLFTGTLLLSVWREDRPVLLSFVTVAAVLARPEFLLLPVAHLVLTLRTSLRSPHGRKYLLITAVLLACWFGWTYSYFGAFLPSTAVKAGSGITRASLTGFGTILAGMYPEMIVLVIILAVSRQIGRAFLAALPYQEKVLGLCSSGVLIVYALSGTTVISRYILFVHPILVILLIRALWSPGLRRWIPEFAVGVLIVQLCLFMVLHERAIRSNIEGFQRVYADFGTRILRSAASDTGAVMLVDVGILAYTSRRPVIDLLGLTSRHIYEAGTRDDAVILGRYHPRYAVVRLESASIDSCVSRWKVLGGDLDGVEELGHERIGPLGILAGGAASYEVYLIAMRYRHGN